MTTKRTKGFDCVAMKRSIQDRLVAETRGMTHQQELAFYERKAATGSLADFWRVVDAKSAATKGTKAEESPKARSRAAARRPRRT